MKTKKAIYNSVTANQNADGSISVVAWYRENRRDRFDMIPVYPHPERYRLEQAAPELLAALQAIAARLNGEWDHPALVAFGPLVAKTESDIFRIATVAITKATGEEVA